MSSAPSHYEYNPSMVMAVIGACVFTILALGSTFRAYQAGARVLIPFLIGAYLEAGGHIARVLSVQDDKANNPYLVAYLTPVVAPSFLAAGLYTVFGRTLTLLTPQRSMNFGTLWISPRWIAPIFITVDIVSFLIQLVGVAGVASAVTSKDASSDSDQLKNGLSALKIGLGIQMFCFIFFAVLVLRFAKVSRRWLIQRAAHDPEQTRGLKHLLFIMVGSALLLTIRGIYRVQEFIEEVDFDPNADHYLVKNEWPFWVLDALPMAGVIVAFGIFHTLGVFPSTLVKFWAKRAHAAAFPLENDELYKY